MTTEKLYDQKKLPPVQFSVVRAEQPDGFFFLIPADGFELVEDANGVIVHAPKASAMINVSLSDEKTQTI